MRVLKAVTAYHTLQHASLIDTNRRVCEVQLSQLMSFTNTYPFSSPEVIRQHYLIRRNRNRRRGIDNSKIFQESSELRLWASTKNSAQVAVCGGFDARQAVRDFAADAIDLITEAQIPVIWALGLYDTTMQEFMPEDVAKYLVSQVLRQNETLLNERSAALSAARYQSASTMNEWFTLLGAVLTGLPQAYFIVDLELVQKSIGGTLSWSALFEQLSQALQSRGCKTVLKVAFLGSRTSHRNQLAEFDQRKILQLPNVRASRVSKASLGKRFNRSRRVGERQKQSSWFPRTEGSHKGNAQSPSGNRGV
jgi:hypothetical protein